MSSRQTRAAIAVFVVFALMLVVGLVSSRSDKKGSSQQRSQRASRRAAKALEPLLLAEVPPGLTRQPDSVADTGPSDLAKAIADGAAGSLQGTSDLRSVLTKAKFVAGYQRFWTSDAGEQLFVLLYQFEKPAGADAYFAFKKDKQAAAATQQGVAFQTFDVAGVPGALGTSGSNEGSNGARVAFTRGPYLVELVANGPSTGGYQDRAGSLAEAQFNRLP